MTVMLKSIMMKKEVFSHLILISMKMPYLIGKEVSDCQSPQVQVSAPSNNFNMLVTAKLRSPIKRYYVSQECQHVIIVIFI